MKVLLVNVSECGGQVKIFEYKDKKKELVHEEEVFAKSHKEFSLKPHQKLEISAK